MTSPGALHLDTETCPAGRGQSGLGKTLETRPAQLCPLWVALGKWSPCFSTVTWVAVLSGWWRELNRMMCLKWPV